MTRALVVTLAWLLPAAILLQAVLAGQGLFLQPRLMVIHGGVGHGALLVAFVLTTAVFLRRDGGRLPFLYVAVTAAMVLQTGLGYMGRTMAVPAAVHVPLGVTILGTAVAGATLLSVRGVASPD